MKIGLAIAVLTRRFYPFLNIGLGLAVYLVGLVMSLFYGAVREFLQMWLFSLGCFGVIWVSSFWTHIFGSMEEIMKELASVFGTKKSEFDNIKKDFVKLISNDRNAFLVSVPAFFFVAYHIWLLFSGGISINMEIPDPIKGNTIFAAYTLVFFSICLYFLFASAYLIFIALNFLRKVTKLPMRLSVLQIRRRVNLEKTTDAILLGTFGWFVGVSLVMTVLFAYSSTVIIAFLVLVVTIGLAFFFIPEILIHGSICKAKRRLHRKIQKEFKSKAKLPLSAECDTHQALLLCTLFDQVDKVEEWIVRTSTLIQLFGSTVIPIATAVIGLLQK